MRFRWLVPLTSILIGFATATAAAKIAPPKPVSPVESEGVRYSADRDGKDQYVLATEMATGKQLWKVRVFHTYVKPWIEEDVQWVFITDLRLLNNSLLVRDEKDHCYAVDLGTHQVQKTSCGDVFGGQKH